MGWPVGQRNGNWSYRNITAAETDNPAGTVWGNGSSINFIVPWGGQGFRSGIFELNFTAAAAGTWRLLVSPQDSDGNTSQLGSAVIDCFLPALANGVGANGFSMCWDDGMLPGNYNWLPAGGALTAASLTLNPIWQGNWDHLVLFMVNNTGGNVTLNAMSALLRG